MELDILQKIAESKNLNKNACKIAIESQFNFVANIIEEGKFMSIKLPSFGKWMHDEERDNVVKEKVEVAKNYSIAKENLRPVRQYNLMGKIIADFESEKEAADVLGISVQVVIKSCNKKHIRFHYYFRYK